MIVRMDKYIWVLLSSEKDSFLEKIQELGVVDISRSSKPVDEESERILGNILNAKSEISSIKNLSNAHLLELEAELKSLEKERDAAAVWGHFDIYGIDKLEAEGVKINFYSVPEKKFETSWAEKWPLTVASKKDGIVYFAVAGDDTFPLEPVKRPEKPSEIISKEIKALAGSIDAYKEKLSSRADEIPTLESYVKHQYDALDRYLASVKGENAAESLITVFEGFAPAANREAIEGFFNAGDTVFFCEDAQNQDNPPIEFKNNKFVKLFEPLTDMYGRPSYDGFDPTPFISIFFLLFFAICMGDMGYGMILVLLGILLKKGGSLSKFSPLVTILGVGTIIVGFVFHTFFSVDFYQAAWLPDQVRMFMVPPKIAGYDGTMVLSLVIGIIHLCLAMVVKTANSTRNQGVLESLATWGWTTLFVGAVVVGAISLAGVIDSEITKTVLIILGIICAIGIFPLNNIHRNPLKNIGSGLWETYNMATGILGDVLSYLRLYALGLAGAMLGFAFNDLAKMALGDGGYRWIFFILIVLVGHTLNLAMAALGAFVHPLRLNFLEFFKNSGYEGSGKKYNPLKNQQ